MVSSAESSNLVANAGAASTNAAAVLTPGKRGDRIGRLGDPALPITVLEWVKGKPVKTQVSTNTYVLVFCALSRASEFALTNLSSLQKIYRDKGVVVVAISDESPEQLRAFVQLRGEDIDFTVAADDLPGRTAKSYGIAFRQYQYPKAYVVRNGKVLWFGHPLTEGLGEAVDEITAGRYNLEQAQRAVVARGQMSQYLFLARQDNPRSLELGRALLAIRTNDAPGLCELASKIATDPEIDNEKRDVALATQALDRAAQLTTTNVTDVAVTRAILLFQTGKKDQGLALARQALASAQSPGAKEEVQICIHGMESYLAWAKTNQVPPVTGTNQFKAPATP